MRALGCIRAGHGTRHYSSSVLFRLVEYLCTVDVLQSGVCDVCVECVASVECVPVMLCSGTVPWQWQQVMFANSETDTSAENMTNMTYTAVPGPTEIVYTL